MLETKTTENGQNGLDFDFKTFELEIEREIDSLFIPLGNEAEIKVRSAPPSMEIERPEPIKTEAPPSPAPTAPEPELTISFDPPSQVESVQADAAAHNELSGPLATDYFTLVLESPVDSSDELKGLLESFQASYLSFDWDFSSPNVAALAEVLNKLKPYCMETPETESLYKIMKAVIQRVAARPDTISQQLVEIMRDAQELLQDFLAPGDEGISSAHRSKLKELIARVHAIRNAQMHRDTRPTGSSLAGRAIPASDSAASGEPSSPDGFVALDGGPENLGSWIGQAQRQFTGTLQGLQDVNRRLLQLEEILVSKPALAPLTTRINSVRSNLEQQISSIRTQEAFWSRLTEVIRERGVQLKDGYSVSGPESHNGRNTVDTNDLAGFSMTPPAIEPSVARTQREQVCLITLAGRKHAVLSANVVKVQPVNGKKVTSISNRGYGVLKDFKPFFKSIKTGLFGTWIGIPANVLKTYQFIPVPLDGLNVEEPTPSEVKGAVLVSNGQQHGIIWSESGSVDLITETIELSPGPNVILGRIRRDTEGEVQVLHVDHLLKMLHEDRTQQ